MKHAKLLVGSVVLVVMAGCASYRTDSDVTFGTTEVEETPSSILILEGELVDREYTVIGPIEAVVKKLTVFHKDPTKEQVDIVLIAKAKEMGANAVINVRYEDGIGFTSWGYIKAEGTAVKMNE